MAVTETSKPKKKISFILGRATRNPIKVWMKFVMVIPKVSVPTATSAANEVFSLYRITKNKSKAAAEKMYDSTIEAKTRWDVLVPSKEAINKAYGLEPVHFLTNNHAINTHNPPVKGTIRRVAGRRSPLKSNAKVH